LTFVQVERMLLILGVWGARGASVFLEDDAHGVVELSGYLGQPGQLPALFVLPEFYYEFLEFEREFKVIRLLV